MIGKNLLTLVISALLFLQSANSASSDGAVQACANLSINYPQLTLSPNQTYYNDINQDYFTAEEWLGPACVLTPTSADLMSSLIRSLADQSVSFAVRGGGWMPIAGSANINSTGILIATTNLTGIELSSDGSTVSVGAGEYWDALYRYLEPYGLSVAGSRIGVVGVPGFLLGGGMSFFSNEYGWASSNVVSYEVILSSGSIVQASQSSEFSDLHWALRAGGNNFGVVTRFELKTIPSAQVAVGQLAYGSGHRESFISSLYNFSQSGVLDPHAFVLPTMSYVPAAGENITYSAALFYNGNDTAPEALEDFLPPATSPETNTFFVRTMANWSTESNEGFDQIHGQNFRFHGFSMLADLEAMFLVHDVFFRHTQTVGPNITGFISTLAMNAISENYLVTNRGTDPAGDPMGIDASLAPYMFCEETLSWSFENETGLVEQLFEDINSELQSKLGNVSVPFLYLNNAGGNQDVFPTYNQTNLGRLLSIREKYDPENLYTDQLVGGFKLPV